MGDPQGKPHVPDAVLAAEDDIAYLRSLGLQDRGRLLVAACRAAAAIEAGRRRSGLPPSSPAPWPPSTVQFMKKWAAYVRNTAQRD